ncbi:MAG: hypothetical protein WAK31_05065 [Chthoniobacterales bacterium]
MRLPNWFKVVWWALLIALLTFFLLQRYPDLVEGRAAPFDVFVFSVWAALVLVPLFQELNLFGLELKQEVRELRSELKSELVNLRTQIRSTAEAEARVNLVPLPDAELPALEKRAQVAIKKTIQQHGSPHEPSLTSRISVDDYTQALFEARYSIERELRRIAAARLDISGEGSPRPITEIIGTLVESQLLDFGLATAIREVYAICSFAVHGQTPSEAQVRFVENVLPGLLKALHAIH